jgi:hypothetical protein
MRSLVRANRRRPSHIDGRVGRVTAKVGSSEPLLADQADPRTRACLRGFVTA